MFTSWGRIIFDGFLRRRRGFWDRMLHHSLTDFRRGKKSLFLFVLFSHCDSLCLRFALSFSRQNSTSSRGLCCSKKTCLKYHLMFVGSSFEDINEHFDIQVLVFRSVTVPDQDPSVL